MRHIDRILIGLAVAMLVTAPAAAQKISYDIGDADFTGMRTFAFIPSPVDDSTAGKTTYDSPIITERTHNAIAAQLEARGLRQVDRNPDVLVSTHRTFKTEYEVYGYGYPYWGLGYGWGWGPYYAGWGGPWYGGSSYYVDERIIGTLVVDVQNARTGELMWRGSAEKHVHEHASPEHRIKRVNKEVDKMFEKFPR